MRRVTLSAGARVVRYPPFPRAFLTKFFGSPRRHRSHNSLTTATSSTMVSSRNVLFYYVLVVGFLSSPGEAKLHQTATRTHGLQKMHLQREHAAITIEKKSNTGKHRTQDHSSEVMTQPDGGGSESRVLRTGWGIVSPLPRVAAPRT